MKTDVCIATYKRPASLAELLRSLGAQRLGPDDLRLVVVDNDAQQGATAVVSAFAENSPFETVYALEPRQGISWARNRALQAVQADTFAFLDDDETVGPDWAATLRGALERFQADAVFGPVRAVLPPGAPPWAASHPFFTRPGNPTGTVLTHGNSGNVLVRTRSLGLPPLSFDPAYALTGGEDADFFFRLHLSGKKLVWCGEAEAFEKIPPDRLQIGWMCRHGFRNGQIHTRSFIRRYPLHIKVRWFLVKPIHLLGGLLALPFLRLFSYPAYVRMLTRVFSAAGQLSALLGKTVHYQEYKASRIHTSSGEKPA
jgi:succinoglycan biosynthesis protein ExoM